MTVDSICELGTARYAPMHLDGDAVLRKWDDWQANRGKERATLQIILPRLNVDDSEVERLVRAGDPEDWMEMVEACKHYGEMHDAVRDMMEAAQARLVIALARVAADEQAEAGEPVTTA